MLLTKTNQLNNNESRKTNSKKTVSCRLTKIETMKITTPTVDWISDLNITINSWELLLFLSFLFLLNYSSFTKLSDTTTQSRFKCSSPLNVLIWDEKHRFVFYIFNITKWTYPTYKPNSVTHWKKLFFVWLIHKDSADDSDDISEENLSSKLKVGWV